MKEIYELRTKIIEKCRHILALTDDLYCKDQLNLIITNSNFLIKGKSYGNKDKILGYSRELENNISTLPKIIHTPSNLATRSHTLAQVCLFILASSAALAVGATFGAWYFNFLTASYFVDSLVFALSCIGIPGACLGLFSYGLYSVQKDPVKDHLAELLENVDLLIQKVNPLGEQYEEQEPLEL